MIAFKIKSLLAFRGAFINFPGQSKTQTWTWLQLARSFSSHPDYTVRKLTVEDKEQVIDFMNRYYRDEPLHVAVKLLETPGSRSKELEDYSDSVLHYGVSLAVNDERDGLVGVMLSEIVKRKNLVYANKSDHYPDPKIRQILQVLEYLERKARMWEALPETCHTLLYMSFGAAHTMWRGKGLCTLLCEESERVAKEIGAGAIRMDCTSAFTAQVAERLKYTKLCGIKYKDMPFAPQPEPPHVEASVFIKKL